MYPTSDVRYRAIDGLVVVLDLRSGEYIILNRAASLMWKALISTADSKERISRLKAVFDAPDAQLDADLRGFAGECLERGFLQEKPVTGIQRRSRVRVRRSAPRFRAWISLLTTSMRLRRFGFARVYQSYLDLAKPEAPRNGLSAQVCRAEKAFVGAESLFLLREAPRDCLPRSLALYRFLLSLGLPATHFIGVQRFPFEAHAWVECGSQVLLDDPRDVAGYTVLARM